MTKRTNGEPYFTKFLFKTGLECPTRLFYHAQEYPQNRQYESFIAHSRNNKRLLTKLARAGYPGGITVDGDSLEEAAGQTETYLQQSAVVLFDAVILDNGFRTKIPILEKADDRVKFFQVHTKAFHPQKHRFYNHHGNLYSKWKSYLLGVAYQYYVLSKAYPQWDLIPHLILPNKKGESNHVRLHQKLENGNLDPSEENDLLVTIDVADEIRDVFEDKIFDEPFAGKSFEAVIRQLYDYFRSGEKYPVSVGKKCSNCEFRIEEERKESGEPSGFSSCWKEACGTYNGEALVFDLIGPGTDRWLQSDIFLQQYVPDSEFDDLESITQPDKRITEKHRQSLQIMKAKGRKVPEEIIKPRLIEELEKWSYPIHFLDFEAGNYALPIRRNRNPYHLVVFQYSCHSLSEDGTWEHHQWIDPMQGSYPNVDLLRALKKVPDILQGTIVQYSQFERYALKTLRKELKRVEHPPDDAGELVNWIENIIDRHDSTHKSGPFLADLSRMVKHFYYNHRMENSLSIKEVLHSVMKVSNYLRERYSKPYKSTNFDDIIWWQKDGLRLKNPYRLLIEMEGQGVQRGAEAMVAYARALIEPLEKSERQRLRQSLLRYCELDTLAMLMIYQHWKNSI